MLKPSYAVHLGNDIGSGASIAMVSAKMQCQSRAGHLRVQRKIIAKAMFPFEIETEEAYVKLLRLGLVKNSQNGYCFIEFDIVLTLSILDF